MKRTPLSTPEIALIAGTRAALGAGLALILGDRLNRDQRHAVGWALFGVGLVTTVPILIQVLKSQPIGDDGSEMDVASHEPEQVVCETIRPA